MIAFLLALVIVWIVLGLIGFVVHGLFWLFILACVLFAGTLVWGAVRSRRLAARRPR